MAAAADIDTKEVEINIKSILISTPTVVTANFLLRELEKELQTPNFFKKLGFPTFVHYLKSIPSVVQLEPQGGYNPNVYPVVSRASSHIDQLVSRQRVPSSKRRGVARRGSYSTRPAPLRRRPTKPPPRPPQTEKVPFGDRPNQGIYVRDLESYMQGNYDRRDLERNGLYSAENLLDRAGDMVERGLTKVYPKLAGVSRDTNHTSSVKCIPAGLEDDFDDFVDEYEFYDEEQSEKDSEEEMSKKAIHLWSQALGLKENSSGSAAQSDETSTADTASRVLNKNLDLPEDDCSISNAMINNFRKILFLHPDGIWASQLQQLYFDQFGVPLDLSDLGHTSAISLASSLPSVFTFCRDGEQDWRLYDARYVTQLSLDAQCDKGNILLPENVRYIPQTIIENIKKLLDGHPNGFRSTDLLQLYLDTFNKPLNLDILGFNTLEEFLMILKNDVTLKKVINYYLLLPKHKKVSVEALQPPKADEWLNLPADSLGVPIPENVVRLGEEIPLQELPPVEMDPDPNKPLFELEVRVAEVMSPVFFYMSLGSTYEELEKMMDDLEKFYLWEEANFKIPLPHIETNLYCAAKYSEFWHRAKITRIRRHGDIEIEYIDYGTPATVKSSELRYLSKEFAYLPAQAICGKLMGVKPLNGENKFPPEVCAEFLELVAGKRLVAHVYQVAERVRHKKERMQLEVILFDVENTENEIVINDYLVEKGLACSIYQEPESPTEVHQDFGDLLPENDSISLQAIDPPVSLPSGSTALSENLPSSHFGNASTTFPASSQTQENSKPTRPPPGFEKFIHSSDFELSTPADSKSLKDPSNIQTSSSMSTEERIMMIHHYYLMNPAQIIPQLLLQDQQSMYQPNPSNMPLTGYPLFHYPQNSSQRTLTCGSVAPPRNTGYNPQLNMFQQRDVPQVASNFIPVPMMQPQPSFLLMNPNPYISVYPNAGSNSSFRVPGYGRALVPPNVPHQQSPTPNSMPRHAPSPTPAYTPITIPEWPIRNLPSFTTAPSKTNTTSDTYQTVPAAPKNFESLEANQVLTRPCTPLTPASAEVANICKLSRPNSSNSINTSSPIERTSSQSIHGTSPLANTKSVNNQSSPDNIAQIVHKTKDNTNLTLSKSPISFEIAQEFVGSTLDNTESEKIEHDFNSNFDLPIKRCIQPTIEVNTISLPVDIKKNEISLPNSSPEQFYSLISSPVDSLIRTSSYKEELSDDYASASENVEEAKQQLDNLTLTEHSPIQALKSSGSIEDIPDSWEHLDLDDTPAKADNFEIDFSQPLDVIIKNRENDYTLIVNSSVEKKEETFKIRAPDNWKDGFNPDINNLKSIDNNNEVKGKSEGPSKFNVKKIPIQELEIQGKQFHLLYFNGTPAVIALEFFKQFTTHSSPIVPEKILEAFYNKMYYLDKMKHSAILTELNNKKEFHGRIQKNSVIRLNKVKVLNLSDIPESLRHLNVQNKSLLEDLKKIAKELE